MIEEKCNCASSFPLVLQWHSDENPIVCSNCNLDAEIENLPTETKLKVELWNQQYQAAYRNWLNEDRAFLELINPENALNKLGFSLVAELNNITPIFYWWHLHEDEQVEKCPTCNGFLNVLLINRLGITKICQNCRILLREKNKRT